MVRKGWGGGLRGGRSASLLPLPSPLPMPPFLFLYLPLERSAVRPQLGVAAHQLTPAEPYQLSLSPLYPL